MAGDDKDGVRDVGMQEHSGGSDQSTMIVGDDDDNGSVKLDCAEQPKRTTSAADSISVDEWSMVVDHCTSSRAVAMLACVCRAAREGCGKRSERAWERLYREDFAPHTHNLAPEHPFQTPSGRHNLDGGLDGLLRAGDGNRAATATVVPDGADDDLAKLSSSTDRAWPASWPRILADGRFEARYHNWATGRPAQDAVVRMAHALKVGTSGRRRDVGKRVNAIVFSAGAADQAFTCGADGCVAMWDVARACMTRRITNAHATDWGGPWEHASVECAAPVAQGAALVTGGSNKGLCLWDPRHKADAPAWEVRNAHFDDVLSVAASEARPLVVSGGADDCIRVFDLRRTDMALSELDTIHGGSVFALAIDDAAGRVFSGAGDRAVCVWDLVTGHWFAQSHGHRGDVYDIALGPQGRVLSASDDGTVCEWRVDGGQGMADFESLVVNRTMAVRQQLNAEGVSVRTHLTCLALLGEREERFLGGAWSGDVLAFDLERGKVQPFGEPITTTKAQEGGGAYGEDGAPVTALAAAGDVVVTGTNCGCIRFSRMVV